MNIRRQTARSTKIRNHCFLAFLTLCISGLLSWVAPSPVQAEAGELDPAFGNQGRVTSDFFRGSDIAFAVASQSDRKIVVAGLSQNPNSGAHFALARYNADGTFDDRFGLNGKVFTNVSGLFDRISAVAIQPDGKIVAVGLAQIQSSPAKYGFAIVRYDPNGALDRTFGLGGIVITDFGGLQDEAFAIAIQPDERILVAGRTARISALVSQFAIARYLPDGRLDPVFGIEGKVISAVGDGLSQINSLAVQPDGKIVAVGSAYNIGGDIAVARYKRNGRLDPGFGADGTVVFDLFKGSDKADAVVVQKDGKITVGGTTARIVGGGNSGLVEEGFVVARLNSDGNLDTSFGGGGSVVTFFGYPADAASMIVQSDGSIVLAGTISNSTSDFALARYRSDGTPDSSFGIGGKVVTDLSASTDVLTAIALQADGRIIAVGSTDVDGGTDFAIARYESGLAIPKITGASVNGKRLLVSGDSFDQGCTIVLDGNDEKTLFESPNVLIGKRSGKRVKSGDKIFVRNSNGIESLEFVYP